MVTYQKVDHSSPPSKQKQQLLVVVFWWVVVDFVMFVLTLFHSSGPVRFLSCQYLENGLVLTLFPFCLGFPSYLASFHVPFSCWCLVLSQELLHPQSHFPLFLVTAFCVVPGHKKLFAVELVFPEDKTRQECPINQIYIAWRKEWWGNLSFDPNRRLEARYAALN